MRVLIFVFAMIVIAAPVQAEPRNVVHCGAPISSSMDTTPAYDRCDIHARRIGYQQESKALRAKIDERRDNYAVPRAEAIASYDQWIDSLYIVPEEDEDAKEDRPAEEPIETAVEQPDKPLSKTDQLNAEQLAKILGNP